LQEDPLEVASAELLCNSIGMIVGNDPAGRQEDHPVA
jgi:hypothetical protein